MIFNKVLYADVTVFNLLIAIIIFLGALLTAKLVALYMNRFLKDKLAKEHLDILSKVAYYSIIVVALLWTLPNVGVKLSGLLVAGGIVGLAVGFASQSIIGNLVSGLFLFIERPVKIGDGVNIDGAVGIVEDIRIISTTLRQYDGLYLRVPNQKVFTATITNLAAHLARRFEYVIGIRYSDDAEAAIRIIKSQIDAHPMALVNPAPLVFVDNLGDSAVNIIVRIWAPTSEWFDVKTELLWKIKKSLEENGIEIPFPQRVIWKGDAAQSTEIDPPNPCAETI